MLSVDLSLRCWMKVFCAMLMANHIIAEKIINLISMPPAPETVNPSLWRQSQINGISGLFKVTDRMYQVRGQDISNITFIEGDTGIIVIDPLVTPHAAKAST